MAESARKSSPIRPLLAAVTWSPPSTPPDTSDLDAEWSEEAPPRYSFIAMKAVRPKPLPMPSAVLAAEIAYDVWDSPRAMLVLVELPGVDPEHVSLTLGSHALHLEVNVPSAPTHPGIASGHHEVTVELPDGLGPDALDASFRDGVLRIRISKAEANVRHINVATLAD